MENIDFFSKDIECTTPIPCNQSWSRAFKKVGVVHSIAPYAEKSAARGAKKGPFCMGILVTLSLSKKKGTYRSQNILHNVAAGCPYELKFKRIGRKSL